MHKISIPQPCYEDLKKMKPCAGGRHCGTCKTDLIDVRKKSPNEVNELLEKNPGACIIAKGNQIDQPKAKWITKTETVFARLRLRFVTVFFLALMVFVSSCYTKKRTITGKFKTIPKEEIK